MIYLAYGMRKSGSTLAFELTRGLLLALGHPQHKRRELISAKHSVNFLNLGGGDKDRLLERLDALVPQHEILVVKTHSAPTQMVRDMARDGRLMCQAVFRDPRDNVLSLVDAGVRARAKGGGAFSGIADLDTAIGACTRAFEVFEQWGEVAGVVTAIYDEVAFRSEAFLHRLVQQLGYDTVEVNLDAVCAKAKQGRFTQFNRGVARRHRHDLSTNGCLLLTARFSDVIERHMAAELDDLDRGLLPLARGLQIPGSFAGLYPVSVAGTWAKARV